MVVHKNILSLFLHQVLYCNFLALLPLQKIDPASYLAAIQLVVQLTSRDAQMSSRVAQLPFRVAQLLSMVICVPFAWQTNNPGRQLKNTRLQLNNPGRQLNNPGWQLSNPGWQLNM